MNAETPAMASWANEICPTQPVRTTLERAIITEIIETMSAKRHAPLRVSINETPTAVPITVHRIGCSAIGAEGWNRSSSAPRVGSARPRSVIAMRMRMNGSASGMPARGNQFGTALETVEKWRSAAWSIPISSPARVAIVNDAIPPSRAAASAGTTRRDVETTSSCLVTDAMRITATPESTVAIIQLTAARRSGERPARTAARSFSAAARVDKPNFVQR
ncbi:unannotated protein [freshwater metagenome]|uniref:Unannotated protein n=1 Tax=freshwater metagenome TaxID=449393 RepID=A0A6J7R2D2_9ZZZZ